jgi:hypothetical protein
MFVWLTHCMICLSICFENVLFAKYSYLWGNVVINHLHPLSVHVTHKEASMWIQGGVVFRITCVHSLCPSLQSHRPVWQSFLENNVHTTALKCHCSTVMRSPAWSLLCRQKFRPCSHHVVMERAKWRIYRRVFIRYFSHTEPTNRYFGNENWGIFKHIFVVLGGLVFIVLA